jgi:hypothetical protein
VLWEGGVDAECLSRDRAHTSRRTYYDLASRLAAEGAGHKRYSATGEFSC